MQNATLAGGVAVGSSAVMAVGGTVINVLPGGALGIGAAAGAQNSVVSVANLLQDFVIIVTPGRCSWHRRSCRCATVWLLGLQSCVGVQACVINVTLCGALGIGAAAGAQLSCY